MILEILCTRARAAGSLASLVRGLAEVPSSHPPPGGRRAHGHPLKSKGEPLEQKGRSKRNLPPAGVSAPGSPRAPHPGAAHPVSKKPEATPAAAGALRGREAGGAANLRGATLGVLGSVFFPPFFFLFLKSHPKRTG